MTSSILLRLLVLLLITPGWVSLAHDPYEISCTAYLRSNRLDLEVDMEFSVAVLLVGVDRTEAAGRSEVELFEWMTPPLEEEATRFFQVFAGDSELPVIEAGVSLGVENHVRFELAFPRPEKQPLGFNARGVQRLGAEGPYGATLTVLDMVNQKVLGQPVLFADDSGVEIALSSLVRSTPPMASAPQTVNAAALPAPDSPQIDPPPQATVSGRADPESPPSRWWLWALLLVLGADVLILGYWLMNRRRRRPAS